MNKITCPKCGSSFELNDTDYADILSQVRNAEFSRELERQEENFRKEKESAVKLAVAQSETDFKDEISEKEREIEKLKSQIEINKKNSDMDARNAVAEKDEEILKLRNRLHIAHFLKIIVIPCLDLLDLVGCAEAVKEVQEWHSSVYSRQMRHSAKVHDLLNGV